MRVAIDGRALTGRYTGDTTYWKNLIAALVEADPQLALEVYTREQIAEGLLPRSPAVSHRLVPAPNERYWTMFSLPAAIRRSRPDLLHVQYSIPPKRSCPCPIVTTIHDVSFRLFPEWYRPKDRILLNLSTPRSVHGAARVITVSESSRKDILRLYSAPEWKVLATPLGISGLASHKGADAQETAKTVAKERYGINGRFVLAVSVLQPRKNFALLAEAFGMARSACGLTHTLVFAGKEGWQVTRESLRAAAVKGGAPPEAVQFTGYVPDEDLPHLYRACDLFAAPALYEGFGLTPLEAMACGAPVVVSDAPAMPEVVGDAAAILPARSVEAWAEGIGRLLNDSAELRRLAEAGPARATQFSWSTTAARTLSAYRDAIERPEGPNDDKK
ncbi:MAG TPA: glycosyltransferase family 1 protein [Chthonomonadales bacterium]|nr:glycosyltransferase family 1 protein [Chthonomonadales bacterium]